MAQQYCNSLISILLLTEQSARRNRVLMGLTPLNADQGYVQNTFTDASESIILKC